MGSALPDSLLKPGKGRAPAIPYLFTQGGILVPHGVLALEMLEHRRYHEGDVLGARLSKPRNPGHWRRSHSIGALLVSQADDFKHLDAHTALKAVQVRAGIFCDVFEIAGHVVKVPQSLSYESMDQGVFNEVYLKFCRWIAENVWPSLRAQDIAKMADAMGGA